MRKAIYASAVAVLISGCATMMNGTKQEVTLKAFPEGTTVRVTPGTEPPQPTPARFLLARRHDYMAVFEKPGYQSQTVEIKSGLSGKLWGNIIFAQFLLIAVPVDFITGAAYKLTPEETSVTLTPLAGSGI